MQVSITGVTRRLAGDSRIPVLRQQRQRGEVIPVEPVARSSRNAAPMIAIDATIAGHAATMTVAGAAMIAIGETIVADAMTAAVVDADAAEDADADANSNC